MADRPPTTRRVRRTHILRHSPRPDPPPHPLHHHLLLVLASLALALTHTLAAPPVPFLPDGTVAQGNYEVCEDVFVDVTCTEPLRSECVLGGQLSQQGQSSFAPFCTRNASGVMRFTPNLNPGVSEACASATARRVAEEGLPTDTCLPLESAVNVFFSVRCLSNTSSILSLYPDPACKLTPRTTPLSSANTYTITSYTTLACSSGSPSLPISGQRIVLEQVVKETIVAAGGHGQPLIDVVQGVELQNDVCTAHTNPFAFSSIFRCISATRPKNDLDPVELGSFQPPPRTGTDMVPVQIIFNNIVQTVYMLFGGVSIATNTVLSDVFAYSVEREWWLPLNTNGGPPPRAYHTTTALPNTGAAIVIGGINVPSGATCECNAQIIYSIADAYVFDARVQCYQDYPLANNTGLQAGAWAEAQLYTVGGFPAPTLAFHSAVLMGTNQQCLVVYGGLESPCNCVPSNRTYAINIFTSLLYEVEVAPGTGPGPRLGHAAFSTDSGQTMYIVGGADYDTTRCGMPANSHTFENSMYRFRLTDPNSCASGVWEVVYSYPLPDMFDTSVITYQQLPYPNNNTYAPFPHFLLSTVVLLPNANTNTSTAMLVGGVEISGSTAIWIFNETDATWSTPDINMHSQFPPIDARQPAVYVDYTADVLQFSKLGISTLDVATGIWFPPVPGQFAPPPLLLAPAVAFTGQQSILGDLVVFFGGLSASESALSQTWAAGPSTVAGAGAYSWYNLNGAIGSDGGPQARFGHTMTVVGNSIYLFGGRNIGSVLYGLWNLVLYPLPLWEPVVDADSLLDPSAPGPRWGHAAGALDNRTLLVIGGSRIINGFQFQDMPVKPGTFLFDTVNITWTQVNVCGPGTEGLNSGSVVCPSDAVGASLEVIDGAAYLMGGSFVASSVCTASSSQEVARSLNRIGSRLLRFSRSRQVWENVPLTPASASPSPRSYAATAVFPSSSMLVLSGGLVGEVTTNPVQSQLLQDMWLGAPVQTANGLAWQWTELTMVTSVPVAFHSITPGWGGNTFVGILGGVRSVSGSQETKVLFDTLVADLACNAGMFSADFPSAPCQPCPTGTYATDPGTQSCHPCPSSTTTAGEGSDDASDCDQCIDGYCNHGACEVHSGEASCRCDSGYRGERCQTNWLAPTIAGLFGLAALIVIIIALWKGRRNALVDVSLKERLLMETEEEMSYLQEAWRIEEHEVEVVGERIAVGSSGVVYFAHWRGLDVALKRLRYATADLLDEGLAAELTSEIHFMQSLRHINICRFWGFGTGADGYPFMVTEYCRRGSLRDCLDSTEQISWEHRINTLRGIASGMAYLHGRRRLHRDLKAENVLMTRDWVAKITDFGASSLLENMRHKHRAANTSATLSSSLSSQGWGSATGSASGSGYGSGSGGSTTFGTPLWLSPEGFTNPALASYPTDVYSFGIVIWEVVTRRLPFDDVESLEEVEQAVVAGRRPIFPDTAPALLREVAEACWAANPADRLDFATVEQRLAGVDATSL